MRQQHAQTPVVCLTCFRPGHWRSQCNQPLSGTRSDPTDLDHERGETPETISPDPPQAPHHPALTQKPSPHPRKSLTMPLAVPPRREGEKGGKYRQSSTPYSTRCRTRPTSGSASGAVVRKERRRRRANGSQHHRKKCNRSQPGDGRGQWDWDRITNTHLQSSTPCWPTLPLMDRETRSVMQM